ncbi:hypothetical protein MUP05_11465, partial [Candidatus Bathyarchaeota archaeon]|nr:hypothetical protein [Candidatus Bathyarchaeota archaeon]
PVSESPPTEPGSEPPTVKGGREPTDGLKNLPPPPLILPPVGPSEETGDKKKAEDDPRRQPYRSTWHGAPTGPQPVPPGTPELRRLPPLWAEDSNGVRVTIPRGGGEGPPMGVDKDGSNISPPPDFRQVREPNIWLDYHPHERHVAPIVDDFLFHGGTLPLPGAAKMGPETEQPQEWRVRHKEHVCNNPETDENIKYRFFRDGGTFRGSPDEGPWRLLGTPKISKAGQPPTPITQPDSPISTDRRDPSIPVSKTTH